MTKELQLVAFVKLPVPGKWKFHLQLPGQYSAHDDWYECDP